MDFARRLIEPVGMISLLATVPAFWGGLYWAIFL